MPADLTGNARENAGYRCLFVQGRDRREDHLRTHGTTITSGTPPENPRRKLAQRRILFYHTGSRTTIYERVP